MNPTPATQPEGIERMPIDAFAKTAYLNYSMYVIMDRALPHVGDGLKPVQRRIVYAMSELGLKSTAKHKKSARTVGDVLGKFHPHGDTACYEAMVLMAQPFSYRYPLVDGQGNWGAPDDPKSFAAMRYTESRLSAYAEVLLSELAMGTVDWGPNFDGTLEEPLTLPARLPNILLNGATGIAVGMATDIPPHNAREVAAACIRLIDNPDIDLANLCEDIQGPDFPTAAEMITPKEELLEIYRSGRGVVRLRAAYTEENGDIVITALPFQTSPARIMEQIALQLSAKKLPMVSDLRDESDHEEPIRIVISPRSGRVDKEALMAHLFATTDLERTYRINMNLIGLDRKPHVMGLKTLLSEWLSYRVQTVRRRLEFRLAKVLERLHILDGLLVAYLNLDEVIRIIRENDTPKPILMKRFSLSDIQAEAILQLRLRHLARLEEMKLRDEKKSLAEEKNAIEATLSSERRMKNLVKREIRQDADLYGDERRTRIVQAMAAKAISQIDLAPVEPITVVLSRSGWVRAAKGHDVDPDRLPYRSGDGPLATAIGKSNQPVVFFDSTGRSYALMAQSLPSARGYGEPLTGHLALPANAMVMAALMANPEEVYLVASDAGYGFLTRFEELITRNQKGKLLLTLPEGALPLTPIPVGNQDIQRLVAVTSEGRMLVFPIRDLPALPKGKGNKIIGIPAALARDRSEVLARVCLVGPADGVSIQSGKRHFTLTPETLAGYAGERGRRGGRLPRGFRKVDLITPVFAPSESPADNGPEIPDGTDPSDQ